MICEPWEVAVVPFPFVERQGRKRRPALVLSQKAFNRHGHTILAIEDLKPAGLRVPCMVRLKLFTLDNRLLVKRLGRLSEADRARATQQLRTYLS